MFRIPYSPKLNNNGVKKPVAFIMHGLLSSSDSWVLNGPNDSIAFLMADAGYDVWLGNSRGNTYGREHAKISPLLPSFWDYTWDEIGTSDLPALIDYTLYQTEEDSVHYIGHSQGTTTFMVMLSTLPRYNEKIKTSHLLAPVGYMENMQSPFAKVAAPLLGQPNALVELFGNTEFLPSNKLFHLLAPEICQENSLFLPMCSNILFLIGGWDSQHFNNVRFVSTYLSLNEKKKNNIYFFFILDFNGCRYGNSSCRFLYGSTNSLSSRKSIRLFQKV